MLPPLPTSKIRFIGNASSLGAKIVLLSKDCRQMAEAIAAKAEHVDLSSDPEFQAEFSLAMLFPEDDADA
ncbi:MAG: hypothetical protein BWZ02_01806 [Lentisphaerae bacterium ADurb.BinA184]|nr:MAG: hypothetical protein BWZ02_01806 [Lentisphaerae bacterium ADurb.BinA184]